MPRTSVSIKKASYSKVELDEIKIEAANYIAKSGLTLSHFDKSGTKEWLNFVCTKAGLDKSLISAFTPSRRTVTRSMEEITVDVENIIKNNGENLAKDGRLFIMIDHYTCNRGTYEMEGEYLGVILCTRSTENRLISMPLAFQIAQNKTHTAVRDDLQKILSVSSISIN